MHTHARCSLALFTLLISCNYCIKSRFIVLKIGECYLLLLSSKLYQIQNFRFYGHTSICIHAPAPCVVHTFDFMEKSQMQIMNWRALHTLISLLQQSLLDMHFLTTGKTICVFQSEIVQELCNNIPAICIIALKSNHNENNIWSLSLTQVNKLSNKFGDIYFTISINV